MHEKWRAPGHRVPTDEAVQGRMARLDVSQQLARYLMDLETRIWELEMDLKELKQRPN
jgi:hypothetical protein